MEDLDSGFGDIADDLSDSADILIIEEDITRQRPRTPPRGVQWFLARPHWWRRQIVRQPWLFPMAAMHLAAVTIQRTWRPCWLRQAGMGAIMRGPSDVPGQRGVGSARKAGADSAARSERAGYVREAMRRRYLALLQQQYDRSAVNAEAGGRKQLVYASFEHYCAALVQAAWRKHRCREVKAVKWFLACRHLTLYNIAACEIQQAWVRFRFGAASGGGAGWRNALDLKHLAARQIQQLWRGAVNKRYYRSQRDIITSFQATGDPTLVLRSILPRESMLLDPSMQVHVRFRLGGFRFPPAIYFKIFTHGAVADLGAFAPRNYAAERCGKPRVEISKDPDRYMRCENNGWRPLAARLYNGQKKDEVEKLTSRKTIPNFHHSRLQRRQDLERQRRMKKAEWMRKLYTQGLENPDRALFEQEPRRSSPKAAQEPTAVALRTATGRAVPRPPPGPRTTTGRPKPASRPSSRTLASPPSVPSLSLPSPKAADEAENEEEDEALLLWSARLDLDVYMESWAHLATSDASEGGLPIGATTARELIPLVHGY